MWYVILLAVCIGGDQLLKWWVTSHLDVTAGRHGYGR